MKRIACCTSRLAVLALMMFAMEAASSTEIDLEAARQQFRAAHDLCTAEGGKLWGISLCGPIMFADPQSRRIVTNQADAEGVLQGQGDVYTGSLPNEVNIANTATPWAGVLWTQIMWPLPRDPSRRNTLLAHELFHRIQSQVAVPPIVEAPNAHLDTLEGRYLLQLEWRALAAALRCSTRQACHGSLVDALLFRTARYQLFPEAAAQERVLELNEGLAEYTGVVAGHQTRAEQVDAALLDLSQGVGARSFVRSFAYATGPALGLLLDKYSPQWRASLRNGPALNALLQRAAAVRLPRDTKTAVLAAATRYDGTALRSAEVQREEQRQTALAANRKKFIDGPVLTIPGYQMNFEFNPNNVQPFGEFGAVYQTLRISDDWGVLEVRNGALLAPNWQAVSVVAPQPGAINSGANVEGDGWTLTLKPDWKVVPAQRTGSFTVVRSTG